MKIAGSSNSPRGGVEEMYLKAVLVTLTALLQHGKRVLVALHTPSSQRLCCMCLLVASKLLSMWKQIKY